MRNYVLYFIFIFRNDKRRFSVWGIVLTLTARPVQTFCIPESRQLLSGQVGTSLACMDNLATVSTLQAW